MHRSRWTRVALVSVFVAACGGQPTAHSTTPAPGAPRAAPAAEPRAAQVSPVDPEAVERATGVAPSVTGDGVAKITWSRDDVPVRVDGAPLPPPAGLTSWAAFAGMPNGEAMVMGDTVVFQDEVDAAMDAAFAHGLEITALHNHFFYDDPPVYFMHIGGTGALEQLAVAVRAVWDAIREVRQESPDPADTFEGDVAVPGGELDAEAISEALGLEVSTSGGVVKASIGREATMHGVRLGGSMGITTWAAFNGSDAAATVDGDFAMTAEEVQPVLRALREAGLHVVALHNHMVGGEPFYYFTHYWGSGSAVDLARAVRSVLDVGGAPD